MNDINQRAVDDFARLSGLDETEARRIIGQALEAVELAEPCGPSDHDDPWMPHTGPVVCRVHGGAWGAGCPTQRVLEEVRRERARQFAQYGTNADLADGTGPDVLWLGPYTGDNATEIEATLRREYNGLEKPTWLDLVREEASEAFAEREPERLRHELLQVAALCVSWVEKLDAR